MCYWQGVGLGLEVTHVTTRRGSSDQVVVSYNHKENELHKVLGYQCGDLVTGVDDSPGDRNRLSRLVTYNHKETELNKAPSY